MTQNRDFTKKKKRLLESLVSNNLLKDKRLYKAFMEIPLERFIPEKYMDSFKIYEDIPNLFYYKNQQNYRTISAPHMITIMLQGLSLEETDDLLILGAKSGYIAALAQKLAPKGEIIILEANSEIANLTEINLKNLELDSNISVIVKNPLEGMPDLTPWQKILVTGAIRQTRIYPLLAQLDKKEGVLYAPIGEEYIQIYTQVLRIGENFYGKKQLQVRFTPLMTQVELDELELITDFDEIDIEINPKKVENTLEKINIKYEASIFDDVDLKMETESSNVNEDEKKEAIRFLKHLNGLIYEFKKEDDIEKCFECVEEMESQIEGLKTFNKNLEIKDKKIQGFINKIRSYNIIRKELERKNDSKSLEQKIEIINNQMEQLNVLQELLNSEIKRLKEIK